MKWDTNKVTVGLGSPCTFIMKRRNVSSSSSVSFSFTTKKGELASARRFCSSSDTATYQKNIHQLLSHIFLFRWYGLSVYILNNVKIQCIHSGLWKQLFYTVFTTWLHRSITIKLSWVKSNWEPGTVSLDWVNMKISQNYINIYRLFKQMKWRKVT